MQDLTKEELAAEILKITDRYGFNKDVMPGYLYAKVLYLLDDIEPLLSGEELAVLKRHGVQRCAERIAGRSDPRGIPDECYAVYMGSVVFIKKDIDGCLDLGLELDEENAQAYADDENLKNGVSQAQVRAMLAGATCGWNLSAAYASSYLKDGAPSELKRSSWMPRVVDDGGNEQITLEGAM